MKPAPRIKTAYWAFKCAATEAAGTASTFPKAKILDAVADRFSIPHEQVLSNLAHYGNTSAATIPLMLDEAVRDGRVQPGHCIASSGFGAGLSWGAALLRWQGPS